MDRSLFSTAQHPYREQHTESVFKPAALAPPLIVVCMKATPDHPHALALALGLVAVGAEHCPG